MSKTMTDVIGKIGRVRVGRVRHSLPRANKTTHLSEKSTSRMTHDVKELNKKVLQFINNQ